MENPNQPVSQNYLGSLSTGQSALPQAATPLSEEAVKANAAALSAFPANDARAVMYADDNGQLQRPVGFSWATSYIAHLNLEVLQATINQTFSAILNPCEEQLRYWETIRSQDENFREEGEYKGENLPKHMTTDNVLEVTRNLRLAEQMLTGLTHLNTSLQWQYSDYKQDTPQRQALSKLQATVTNCSLQITADTLSLNSVCEKFPPGHFEAATPPTRMAPEGVQGDPLRNIDDYLKYFGPERVTPAQVEALIQEGQEVLSGILNGTLNDAKNYPGGSETALNALTWKLMSLAMNKGQGHSHGSFAIEDTNGRLFAFLNSSEYTNRPSSHYKHRRVPGQESYQQGVNVNTGTMPGDQHHLLFGQILSPFHNQAPLLFFKMESSDPVGGGVTETVMHVITYAQSLGRKMLGGNEGYGLSKEHTPPEIKKPFTAIIADLQNIEASEGHLARIHHNMATEGFRIEDTRTASPESLSSRFGISYMTCFLKEAKALQVPLDEVALASCEKALSDLHLDHLDRRAGKEVYLTEEELRS